MPSISVEFDSLPHELSHCALLTLDILAVVDSVCLLTNRRITQFDDCVQFTIVTVIVSAIVWCCLVGNGHSQSRAVVSAHNSGRDNALPVQSAETGESFAENQQETSSVRRASESLECNGQPKQDHGSETGRVIVNGTGRGGNAAAGSAEEERRLQQLRHWQSKYPGRTIVPHICTTCGAQFLQAVQLRKHMIKHAAADDADSVVEFPYTCYACRRHFLFANDLRRHLISHSDDRPHRCLVCHR